MGSLYHFSNEVRVAFQGQSVPHRFSIFSFPFSHPLRTAEDQRYVIRGYNMETLARNRLIPLPILRKLVYLKLNESLSIQSRNTFLRNALLHFPMLVPSALSLFKFYLFNSCTYIPRPLAPSIAPSYSVLESYFNSTE